jgi:hypothetical protein
VIVCESELRSLSRPKFKAPRNLKSLARYARENGNFVLVSWLIRQL